jgi:hypothetical protein
MIEYYFERQLLLGENTEHYRLFAVIDDLYYWKVEGSMNAKLQSITIQNLISGFNSEEICESYKKLSTVDITDLRNSLGSFAYFIERSVNGFKSYIMWISPHLQTDELPWKLSLN